MKCASKHEKKAMKKGKLILQAEKDAIVLECAEMRDRLKMSSDDSSRAEDLKKEFEMHLSMLEEKHRSERREYLKKLISKFD